VTSDGPAAEGPAAEGPAADGPAAEGPAAGRLTVEGSEAEGPAAAGPAPAWLTRLAAGVGQIMVPPQLRAPDAGGRASAVLLLFGETAGAPDLLIVQRGQHLRRHAGQPAFPGGAIEPSDGGPVDAALREAAEEVGVDPAGVEVLAVLPELYIPRSGFRVTPVLAWWRRPSPLVAAADGEIVSAARARLTDLADPANRLSVRHPSGPAGPAFRVHGMLIWGFTALLVDRLLALGGWEQPWDTGREEDLPPDVLDAAARG
jgi:8-oxo-dGTP pyrophosphatase MutT (NUDIX family)